MTFSDLLWQMKRPGRVATRDVASYVLRFVICLLTKDARSWAGNTPAQLCLL
ncbi:hypothetical protein EXIGLDRAFT_837223 [Exidia glandulosa HHB12029]|uniref:Uncharacterized protein n=1 Tax=Exidia glandulosa HHB12029 TaxID=1314781 RepID=A0A165H093_EXIGL|nr:hypothetical protein EXIGLDRAFT_837223 [Exidia glandulosa HHB12029]